MCVCASTRHGAGREARACALRSKVRKCCARTHTYVKHEHGHEHEHARQVRKLRLKHERDLRLGIRKILVQHGEGCDQPTPLEAPLYRHAALQQVGPDGNALETQDIHEQSLSNVLNNIHHLNDVHQLNSGQADAAPAAAAPAGGAAEDMAVVSLADGTGTDNPS